MRMPLTVSGNCDVDEMHGHAVARAHAVGSAPPAGGIESRIGSARIVGRLAHRGSYAQENWGWIMLVTGYLPSVILSLMALRSIDIAIARRTRGSLSGACDGVHNEAGDYRGRRGDKAQRARR